MARQLAMSSEDDADVLLEALLDPDNWPESGGPTLTGRACGSAHPRLGLEGALSFPGRGHVSGDASGSAGALGTAGGAHSSGSAA